MPYFSRPDRTSSVVRLFLALLFLIATSAFADSPSTVNNDDSCDVTVGPAATLLVPHFEVDFVNRTEDTRFTITNVTRLPQIAHVTIWTDWSYPVLNFNIYLTGYDVQGISMNQILNNGTVAQNNGTGPTTAQSPLGPLSAGFTANPNFAGGGTSINCSSQPGALSVILVAAVRVALTTGIYNPGGAAACVNRVGGVHANAIGYITIDLVASCTSRLPTDPLYYTNDLLFDNVLIGDYQQLGSAPVGTTSFSFDGSSNAMVHIRAVPEGGGAGSKAATALPYTFYDRYTPAASRASDRRQPLPSTFAARVVQGGPAAFATNLNIWREGFDRGSCADAGTSATMDVAEVVRFDEHENPFTLGNDSLVSRPRLPATSSTSSSSSSYPAIAGSDFGGWLYLNLNNGGSTTYSVNHEPNAGPRPSQNWVTVTMFGDAKGGNRMTAEFDAASLGNGCSPAAFPSSAAPIGPAGGVFLCPPGTTLTNGSTAQCIETTAAAIASDGPAQRRRAVRKTPLPSAIANDDSCDIKVGPAATLLLPYFEVDLSGASGRTTLFTVTNVSRYPQIAHVTLWTDYAYPVLTFNLFLGGYDVQSINVADVLIRNTVAPPNGTTSGTTSGSTWPASNPNLRAAIDCAVIPGVIPATIMAEVRKALTTGATSSCNRAVGSVHASAIGYATIDVVASCTTRSPADPRYYTDDILFDNVLIGDYQQLVPAPAGRTASSNDAGGNPMVHIRAIPEGGGAGSNVDTRLPYTFYDRYTPATTRTIDRRQPLPSLFAARYIEGGTGAYATNLTVWREGFGIGSCADASTSATMIVSELVKFDEHENPNTAAPCGTLCPSPTPLRLNAASSTASYVDVYLPTADAGGWLYLNLNNGGSTSYSVTKEIGGQRLPTNARSNLSQNAFTTGPRPSQNWVTVTQFGNTAGGNRLIGEFDAATLGNGCSPAVAVGAVIGPAGGVLVCPPGTTLTDGSTAKCTGTNINPPP
ncbi:MAG TPA: hypothetical protein VGQ21_11785 [Thermoanaerobaculia bacterium]|jgi:hypothetical protein|nr:hypothetical protein [Thermoanaerobaculia bacterium]